MRFRDIKPFVDTGTYSIHVGLNYLKQTLEEFDKGQKLEMDPDFQRGHVWNDSQRIKYMEYFLRGGRSGKEIFFNCAGWQRHNKSQSIVLVDGKQRLTAALKFIDNEIPVFGHFFSEYDDSPDTIRHRFIFNVNELQTREEVLQWYLEMNTGGVVHTDEEIEKVKRLLEKEKMT